MTERAEEPKRPAGRTDWSRWSEIDAIFDRALDLPPEERAAFLEAAASDPHLRHVVERLLRALPGK